MELYEVLVEGHLDESWSDWFEGLTIHSELDESGRALYTVLSGPMDQSTLHGILMRVRDLGLTLVCASRKTEQEDDNRFGQDNH